MEYMHMRMEEYGDGGDLAAMLHERFSFGVPGMDIQCSPVI